MATAWTTGIALGARRLEWTVLHRAKDAWVVERRGECARGGEDDAAALKEASSQWRGELVAGLSAADSLLKVARLPGTDEGELREMAEFQADRYSPWPVETMGVGVEVLKTEGEESLVALGLAQSDAVEAVGEPFRAAGAPLDGVDLTVLGWWRMLRERGELPESGDWLGVRVGGGAGEPVEALLVRDGTPLWAGGLSPVPGGESEDVDGGTDGDATGDSEAGEAQAPAGTGGAPEGADLDAWAAGCAADARYALTALEAEWGAPGNAGGASAGGVWAEPGGEAAGGALAEALGLEFREGAAGSASEGIARRRAERAGGAGMDLAPAAWAEAESERRFRTNFWRAAVAVLLLWAAGVAGFLMLLNARRAQLANLEREVKALEVPALDVRALRGKLLELAQYADRSASPLECLRVAVEAMPDDIEMDSFVYTKGQDVKIRGNAREPRRVYDWQAALEASGLFSEVKMDGVTKRNDQHAYGLTLVLPGGEGGGEGGSP